MLKFCCALLLLSAVQASDWPRFRGPNGSGVDETSTALPVEFNPGKNVAWKASVPFGRSSPVIFGNQLFLTASENGQLITLSYDARNGKLLWRREVKSLHNHKTYKANDSASASVAADVSGVYAFFTDLGLISYSLDGKERWRLPLGPFDNFYGMASSPIIDGDLLFVLCDQNRDSFLLALDKKTGRQRWKAERPGMMMGWGVPMVHTSPGGEKLLIVMGSTRMDAYYPATGERRWWFPLVSEGAIGTPVWNGESIIVNTSGSDKPMVPSFESTLQAYDKDKDARLSREEFQGYKDWAEHFNWIDADHSGFIDAAEWKFVSEVGVGEYGVASFKPGNATGQIPASAATWRVKRNIPYVPSPVLYKGVYFMVRDGGIVTSLNPEKGEILKQGRAADSLGPYFASPVAADGKIFLLNEAGKLTVLSAKGEWEVLGVNDMADETYATPAIANGRIYVRTRSSLYCFAAK